MHPKTSDLSDACPEAQICRLNFVSYGRRRAFAGPLRTVRYQDGIRVIRDVVHQPGQGSVLVIDGRGVEWQALLGDVMADILIRNGWAGVVVNGLIRDSREIDAMDIGVKALGTVPQRALIASGGEANVPVQFGGITFTPQARLVADEDGVLVLPPGVTESDVDLSTALAATAAYAASHTA